MRETDRWPVVQARWFRAVDPDQPRAIRVLVVHDMEFSETEHAAEDVAHYFATTETKASAHVCVDADSVIQCVPDHDIAYAAPGCNADGIQIELAGFGRQSRDEWLDDYGKKLLDRAANVAAQYCLKYELPVNHLTNEQLDAGAKGIVGHVQVSEVYKQSDHTDPGPNFPWDVFMTLVRGHIATLEHSP